MSSNAEKKQRKQKKKKQAERKELIKKISVISFVIVAIALVIVLSITLGDKDGVKSDTGSNNGSSSSEYTFMNLGSSGCIPCDNMVPVRAALKKKYEGEINVAFYDVNKTEKGAELSNKYDVSTIPTLIYLKNGKEVYREVGYHSQSEIEANFERLGWI